MTTTRLIRSIFSIIEQGKKAKDILALKTLEVIAQRGADVPITFMPNHIIPTFDASGVTDQLCQLFLDAEFGEIEKAREIVAITLCYCYGLKPLEVQLVEPLFNLLQEMLDEVCDIYEPKDQAREIIRILNALSILVRNLGLSSFLNFIVLFFNILINFSYFVKKINKMH